MHGFQLLSLSALRWRVLAAFAVAMLAAGCTSTETLRVETTPAESSRYAALVIDGRDGRMLYGTNATAPRFPASLTKMMTLYMVFEALDQGRLSKTTEIPVSAHAAGQPPSKIGIRAGQAIDVETAILALCVKSANDVACAIGEHISGTESAFARDMTNRARRLGMSKTTFRNASGLPDDGQVTTARDMATLGRALQDHFPEHYKYFATRSFKWKGNTYSNHNRLLGRVARRKADAEHAFEFHRGAGKPIEEGNAFPRIGILRSEPAEARLQVDMDGIARQ